MAEDQAVHSIVRQALGLSASEQPMETNALLRELARRMILSGFSFDTNGALTGIDGSALTDLDADELTSGTIPDGRFPATLPAASGANLTSVNAATLDGLDWLSFDWFNVKSATYGAVGDGSTNDTTAIQAAIDAANTAGGGVVFFPEGTYRVGALTWKQGVSLVGAGLDVSILKSNAASALLTYDGAPLVNVQGIIRDLTFDGNSQGTIGFKFTDLSWFFVQRVKVHAFTTKGVELNGCITVQFDKCRITSSVIGIDLLSSATPSTPNNIAFRDCVINSNTTYGLQCVDGALIVLDGCTIESNGTASNAATGAVKFGNMCTVGEGVACVVRQCWMESNSGHSGIRFNLPANSTALHIVEDTQIFSGTRDYGVYITASGGTLVRYKLDTVVAQSAGTADIFEGSGSGGLMINCIASTESLSGLGVQFPSPTGGVNTLRGHLRFTDATFDIGASGATRPRDLFLSRNAVIGGTATVTGGQVAFPAAQSASADANTLDDYEEGSWTPVIGGSGGTSGQAYSTQIGRYIKIGRLVTAIFRCTLSTEGTITGNVQIQGLPFTVVNVSGLNHPCAILWDSLPTTWVSINAAAVSNTTTAAVVGAAAAAGSNQTALTATDIDDNSELAGTLVYLAAS